MKPIIGITSNFDVEKNGYFLYSHYVRSIEQAGGLPLILPYTDSSQVQEVLGLLDGLLLTGGGDFPTHLYGEAPHPEVARIIPARDEFEFSLCQSASKQEVPLFGICRGMQIMNVVAGGSIYPHTLDEVPSAIDHRDGTALDKHVHKVRLSPGSRLWDFCGGVSETFDVNSFHHQAIKRLGAGYKVSAVADDGIVEAIESEDRAFNVGIQWHPEWMYDAEPACKNMFDNFVMAANDYRRRRAAG